MTSVFDFGVENFRYFKLRVHHQTMIDGGRLNTIGDWDWIGWFQHRNVEHQVYGLEDCWES